MFVSSKPHLPVAVFRGLISAFLWWTIISLVWALVVHWLTLATAWQLWIPSLGYLWGTFQGSKMAASRSPRKEPYAGLHLANCCLLLSLAISLAVNSDWDPGNWWLFAVRVAGTYILTLLAAKQVQKRHRIHHAFNPIYLRSNL